jgi:hypothetical protein
MFIPNGGTGSFDALNTHQFCIRSAMERSSLTRLESRENYGVGELDQ